MSRLAINVLAAMATHPDKWWTPGEIVEKAGLGFWGGLTLWWALGELAEDGRIVVAEVDGGTVYALVEQAE